MPNGTVKFVLNWGESVKENLLEQGVELMIFGMGTVFVFLVVLIGVTVTMSFIVQRFFPDAVAPILPNTQGQTPTVKNDEQLMAVITAAVHKYRSRHKR